MKTLSLSSLLLSGLLLVLIGCDESPTGLDPAEANLDATDNGSSVGLNPRHLESTRTGEILVYVPKQTVDAIRDGEPTRERVEAKIQILSDGTAEGELRLSSREPGEVIILFGTGLGPVEPGVDEGGNPVISINAMGYVERGDGKSIAITATIIITATSGDDSMATWSLDIIGSENDETQVLLQISFEAYTEIRIQDADQ